MRSDVYISCGFNEREFPLIKSLCSFLNQSNYAFEFSPNYRTDLDYQPIDDDAIRHCSAFVAGISKGYSRDKWLMRELDYAVSFGTSPYLRKPPRVFALLLNNDDELTFIREVAGNDSLEWLMERNRQFVLNNSLEWLTEENYRFILETAIKQ